MAAVGVDVGLAQPGSLSFVHVVRATRTLDRSKTCVLEGSSPATGPSSLAEC